jgi:hypothetical protein
MSEYWLREGVYCAEANDSIVLLDLRVGRYFALNSMGVSLQANDAESNGGISNGYSVKANAQNRLLLEMLSANDFLTTNSAIRNRFAARLPRATSTIDCSKGSDPFRWSPLACARFAASRVSFSIMYHLTSLRRCVELLRKRQGLLANAVADESHLKYLMSHFIRLRAFSYTSRNRCVLDTLVLCDFLRRNRVNATFAIGVSTRPFRAHCWAQCGSIALNYSSESVESFTPLLVV